MHGEEHKAPSSNRVLHPPQATVLHGPSCVDVKAITCARKGCGGGDL